MEMIDNGFSKRLIRELLNYTNKAAGAKFGETNIKVKFELTWSIVAIVGGLQFHVAQRGNFNLRISSRS